MATGKEQKKIELIWQNSSLTSDYSATTIPIDISSYSAVLFLFNYSTSTFSIGETMCLVGEDGQVQMFGNLAGTNPYAQVRVITTTENSIYIGDCVRRNLRSSSAGTTNNSYTIPVSIYGIRF